MNQSRAPPCVSLSVALTIVKVPELSQLKRKTPPEFLPSFLHALIVGVPLDPGDHAFLSYGPVSNDDLLQFYGFVERDNPSDTYVLEDMGKWLREVNKL